LPTSCNFAAIPVFAQLLEGNALQLLGLLGAPQRDGVLLLVHLHACLTGFDAGFGQRHVGVVAEGEPAIASAEPIPQGPGGAIAGLLAQIQTVTIAK
jgi:hypothetical protein